jgi:hypothetical protein
VALAKSHNLTCIMLTTTVEECVERVKIRRVGLGIDKPLNEGNLRATHKKCSAAFWCLKDAGVSCLKLSGDEALTWVTEVLR